MGIRPEHIEVVAHDANAIEAQVITFEPTGSETMVIALLSGKPVTVITKERFNLAPDTRIWLRPNTMQQHYFGADGMRISND
jgi:multiple sugar transport system ATP-binding protein